MVENNDHPIAPPPSLLRRRSTRLNNATSTKSTFSSIISGYVAGSVGLFVGHPLDSLKVRGVKGWRRKGCEERTAREREERTEGGAVQRPFHVG